MSVPVVVTNAFMAEPNPVMLVFKTGVKEDPDYGFHMLTTICIFFISFPL